MKKRLLALWIICVLTLLNVLPVFATDVARPIRVVDNAGLLSDSEEAALVERLDQISMKYQSDVVVYTVEDIGSYSRVMDFADDTFDYNGYGLGYDRSGIILVISMAERDWYISTRGFGILAFTDAGIRYVGDQITPSLRDGDYNRAFNIFADYADDFYQRAKNGDPFDEKDAKAPFGWGGSGALSVLIGSVVGFFVNLGEKKKLKSVSKRQEANDYVRRGSLQVTEARDFYLYRNVSKTKRETSSGSGSSTHISSSGASHGGGGGKF